MALKTRVITLLNDVLRMCDSIEDGNDLKKEVKVMLERLDTPLRVAVVGVMKAGKSTLLNAMMKEKILFTGNVETTYTVSWFKYGSDPSLRIVFRDDNSIVEPFENLGKWTVRDVDNKNPRIDDVKYVEIRYPSDILKTMELIDTPGLQSTYKVDSENTLDFLGLKQAEEITIYEASTADAIIYAFSRGAQSNDTDILKAFHGDIISANTSPINALGVFTKSDIFWDTLNNPMETAKGITKNIMSNNEMKKLLYTINPVSAKLVENLLELTDEQWEVLRKLTLLDEDLLTNLLFDYSFFCESDISDIEEAMEKKLKEEEVKNICTKEERKDVCSLCGQYGIYSITKALNANMSRDKIIDYMYEKSGIKSINDLILQHFGNRSLVIKVQYIFSRLTDLCTKNLLGTNDENLKEVYEYLIDEINHIQDTEHIFRELKILQSYYNDFLGLKNEEEIKQLLEITCEYGSNCEARLGAVYGTSIKELLKIAYERIQYWNSRANDITISRYYKDAANVLSRSCDIMYYHLKALSGYED